MSLFNSTSSEFLKKYNIPGPRYTSYPTVPYWDSNPTEVQWLESLDHALKEADASGVGAAIYLHIPFCQSLCTYCGCNTRITRRRDVGVPYSEIVLKELDLYLERLGRSAQGANSIRLSELHLGGGTPTFLEAPELQSLIEGIFSRVTVMNGAEFSIEADPRVTKQAHLDVLKNLGFRRLSLGVQDFDLRVQDVVNRVQSDEQVLDITDRARRTGFASVNYDLIYGLPLQTRASIEKTIQTVSRHRPDRIAFYAYAHVPWIKPGQRRFTEADLPSGDEKRALYELGRKILEEVGYREVGMDHFALESDSLWKSSLENTLHRNFMGYTSRHTSPLFGLGVSSIGDSWTAFAQNEKLLETYQSRVQAGEIPIHRGHLLTQEDQILRRHVLNLMTQMKTDWASFEMNTDYLREVPTRLRELEKDGLVELTESSCRVTEEGRAFLRNICMAFDARLVRKAPATSLFSKTI